MAKKDEKKEKKSVLERVYNVPLRKKYLCAPNWKRTNRAVSALREFVKKHMKATEVKIGKYANLELWKHGIKNPPHHIKINCKKDEDGIVRVELVGAPEEKPKEEKKKLKKEKETEIKVKDALGEEEEKTEKEIKEEELEKKEKEIKEEKAEKAKEIQKEEIKELKKEHPRVHHPPKQAMQQKRIDTHQSAPLQK